MMARRSVRFQLTVWYAAVLTATLAAFGCLLWFSVRHQLTADIDHDLESSAGRFESFFRKEYAEAQGGDVKDELSEFSQGLPADSIALLHGASGFEFRYPSGVLLEGHVRSYQRTFAVDGEPFVLELRASMDSVRHTLAVLGGMLVGLLPFVIAIACLGGAWLSRRALAPVRNITASARLIGIDNLSERLVDPGTGDELAQLTRVLNSMLARLEGAVQALSQFSADASHELRTPLAVIRTTAELALRRPRTADSYQQSLASVAAEAERMTQLVEDLLGLARSGARAAEMPREPLDVREVLRSVCDELRDLAQARGIALNISLGDDSALIAGNRAALHRLFVALLDNALKFSASGGAVNAVVRRAGGRVTVSVQDFGRGIRSADLPHIFKRFYRADPARSGGGHGLGLPLAEAIAQAHRASVEVHSIEGAGSTFQVVFAERPSGPDAGLVAPPSSGNLQSGALR